MHRCPATTSCLLRTSSATSAVSIHNTSEHVWPWIAQLGQGRGGLYSYDVLENLVGCDMHSADRFFRNTSSSR